MRKRNFHVGGVRATVPARNRQVCQFLVAKADCEPWTGPGIGSRGAKVRLGLVDEGAGRVSAVDALKRDPGFLVALAFGLNGFQHQFFGDLADRSAQRPGRIA
jgi:hypothetical protein